MGWPNLKLKRSHINIAYDKSREDAFLDDNHTPEEVLGHYVELCKGEYRLVVKPKRSTRLSKMATTYYRQIRLPSNWAEMEPHRQANLLAHEWRHTKQWRKWGKVRFACRYLMSRRFRAAVEIECYCESARAMKSMGYTQKSIDLFAVRIPNMMVDSYQLRGLARDDFRGHFQNAVTKAIGSG